MRANFKNDSLLFYSKGVPNPVGQYFSPFHLLRYSAPSFNSLPYVFFPLLTCFLFSTQNYPGAFSKKQQPFGQHYLSPATMLCFLIPFMTVIHLQSPSSNAGAYLPATSFHPSQSHKSTLAKSKASLTANSILHFYSLCKLIALLLLRLLSFSPFHLPSRNLETTLYSPFPHGHSLSVSFANSQISASQINVN